MTTRLDSDIATSLLAWALGEMRTMRRQEIPDDKIVEILSTELESAVQRVKNMIPVTLRAFDNL